MAEIFSLSGLPMPKSGTPDAEVIAQLEGSLRLAKAGEIDGVLLVLHFADTTTSIAKRGMMSLSMLGELDVLHHMLVVERLP